MEVKTDREPTYEERCRIMLPADPPAWLVEDDTWWPIVGALSVAGAFGHSVQITLGEATNVVLCTVVPCSVLGGVPSTAALQAQVVTEALHAEDAVLELVAWLRRHLTSPLFDPKILEET